MYQSINSIRRERRAKHKEQYKQYRLRRAERQKYELEFDYCLTTSDVEDRSDDMKKQIERELKNLTNTISQLRRAEIN